MTDIFDKLSEESKAKIKEVDQPVWIEPMLATLTEDYFSDPEWIYERKLDGQRCIIFKKGNEINLYSRNAKSLNSTYPDLEKAIEKTEGSFIADGELVAFDETLTSFSRLQNRMKNTKPDPSVIENTPVYYYVLDLVYLDKYDITELPLRERKSILKKAFNFEDPIRYTEHRNKKGKEFHKEACEKGWEGIIAKKADSRYVHSRSKNWLKFKCVNQQEFVIVGFTDPEGERVGFGALLIGFYKNNTLKYAGKVGTGYDDELLADLRKKMDEITVEQPPVESKDPPDGNDIHWIKPELVGQFGFTEWTNDEKLRHPRFLGMRKDKEPKEVRKEKPR